MLPEAAANHLSRVLLERLRDNDRIGFLVLGRIHPCSETSEAPRETFDPDEEGRVWTILCDSLLEPEEFLEAGRLVHIERIQSLKLQMIARDVDAYCAALEIPVSCLTQGGVDALAFCHFQERDGASISVPIGFRLDDDKQVAQTVTLDRFRTTPLISTHFLTLLDDERPTRERRAAAAMALDELVRCASADAKASRRYS